MSPSLMIWLTSQGLQDTIKEVIKINHVFISVHITHIFVSWILAATEIYLKRYSCCENFNCLCSLKYQLSEQRLLGVLGWVKRNETLFVLIKDP